MRLELHVFMKLHYAWGVAFFAYVIPVKEIGTLYNYRRLTETSFKSPLSRGPKCMQLYHVPPIIYNGPLCFPSLLLF